MFVNNANGQRGLVCQYDVVCFDEVSGISFDQKDGVGRSGAFPLVEWQLSGFFTPRFYAFIVSGLWCSAIWAIIKKFYRSVFAAYR